MERFKQFCKEWDKDEVEMERELFKTLKAIHDKKDIVILNDGKLYYAKINYLSENGFIFREHPKNRATGRGERAITRGWVEINIEKYKKLKRRELWEKITPNLLQGTSIFVALILGILGLFFPRDCSKFTSEIKDVVPQIEENMVNTATQTDEITQASDSTSKKDSNKGK